MEIKILALNVGYVYLLLNKAIPGYLKNWHAISKKMY